MDSIVDVAFSYLTIFELLSSCIADLDILVRYDCNNDYKLLSNLLLKYLFFLINFDCLWINSFFLHIYKDWSNISFLPPFLILSLLFFPFIFFKSFAHVATNAPSTYVKPELTPMNFDHSNEYADIEIVNGRHACLELQDNVVFIPNDYLWDNLEGGCTYI